MRVLSIAAVLLMVSSLETLAVDRYNSKTMTCDRLTKILEQDGSAVLRYPSSKVPSMMRFDLYVSSVRHCPNWQNAGRASVPTSDAKSCRVMRCFDKSRTMPRL